MTYYDRIVNLVADELLDDEDYIDIDSAIDLTEYLGYDVTYDIIRQVWEDSHNFMEMHPRDVEQYLRIIFSEIGYPQFKKAFENDEYGFPLNADDEDEFWKMYDSNGYYRRMEPVLREAYIIGVDNISDGECNTYGFWEDVLEEIKRRV